MPISIADHHLVEFKDQKRLIVVAASSYFASERTAEAYFHILLFVGYPFCLFSAIPQNFPLFIFVRLSGFEVSFAHPCYHE